MRQGNYYSSLLAEIAMLWLQNTWYSDIISNL